MNLFKIFSSIFAILFIVVSLALPVQAKVEGDIFEQRFFQSLYKAKGHKLAKKNIASMMGLIPSAVPASNKLPHIPAENGEGDAVNGINQEDEIDEYNSDIFVDNLTKSFNVQS